MSAKLINVRLDQERLRKARHLRESGVALSDLVREAIDEKYEVLRRSGKPGEVRDAMTRLFERYPDPPDLAPRTYDVSDAKAARAAIARKLRGKKG